MHETDNVSHTSSPRLDPAGGSGRDGASVGANTSISTSLLLVLVFGTVFLVPLFPVSYHWLLYNISYTGIYFLAALALERNRRTLLLLAASAVVLEWSSDLLDLPALTALASTVNILFFILIVILLIARISRSKKVTGRLIVESINCYLLLGLIFSLLVINLGTYRPEAYSFTGHDTLPEATEVRSSDCFYYAFVTMTTIGYGDLLPITAQSKSLAILMGMTGQLYLAVIIAMLVGKYSASTGRSNAEE